MLKNDKGFTYPLSLCMLLLISTFVIVHSQLFLNEKRLKQETDTILAQEYYYLFCVRKVETQLQNGEMLQNPGVILLSDGRMDFTIEDTGTLLKITFNLTLSSGEKAIGFAYYNKTQKKMVKWVEKN